jgi:hypothetical protein
MLHLEFQSLGYCYTVQASKCYKYSKSIWGVLKTGTVIIVPSKQNLARFLFVGKFWQMHFEHWEEMHRVDIKLFFQKFS